jgi:hypothetical protein
MLPKKYICQALPIVVRGNQLIPAFSRLGS